jgi:hypothetical protein
MTRASSLAASRHAAWVEMWLDERYFLSNFHESVHIMASTRASLPHTDAYVELALLDGGSFVGDLSRMHAGERGSFRMYNWAFYIAHQGRHILWDLGLDEVRTSGDEDSYCVSL